MKKIEQLEEKAREQSAKIENLEQEKAALQSELEEMKSKVGEVLSLLFHRQCSEAEATARLSLLGCEIEYVNDAEVFEMLEAKESKWEAGSSQFLLDDKQKLSKLMEGRQQLALTAGLSADSSHRSRLPIVSFPTPRISQPGGSAPRSLVQPLKLPDFSAKSTSKAIKPCSPDTLPSIKDQDMKLADDTYSSLSLDSISSLPDVDHIKSRGPTLKFVYSVQGGGSTSSQPWIAKLPFTGEAPVVNSPIKPMKDLTFKAEMTSDEFGQGLAMVMGRK